MAKSGIDTTKFPGVRRCWQHNKSEGHILSVEELANVLQAVSIPGLRRAVSVDPEKLTDILAPKRGIIYFKDYWTRGNEEHRNRSGDHIDLWNGSRMTELSSWFRIQWHLSWRGVYSSYYDSKAIWFWEVHR